MGTNCTPLVADFFCFVMKETSCCLSLTMTKLMSWNYLILLQENILNIDNTYFEKNVSK